MRSRRTSILELMILGGFVALSVTALRSNLPIWCKLVTNGAYLMLILASIRARYASDEKSRAWWFGFALFGWSYLIAGTSLGSGLILTMGFDSIKQPLNDTFKPALLVSYKVKPTDDFKIAKENSGVARTARNSYDFSFHGIYHDLSTLVIGYLGAWIIAIYHRRLSPGPRFTSIENPPAGSEIPAASVHSSRS